MKTLLIIFMILSSAAGSAQMLEVSREKNALLINKYLATKNSKVPVNPPAPLIALPASQYTIELRNVRVPVEFTYVYFSYVIKPKNNVIRFYKPSSK